MLEMRESCPVSASVIGAPERTQFPSFPAQMGMKRLNDNLEIFEQNYVEVMHMYAYISNIIYIIAYRQKLNT